MERKHRSSRYSSKSKSQAMFGSRTNKLLDEKLISAENFPFDGALSTAGGTGTKPRPFLIPETPSSSRSHDLSLSAIAANTSAKKRRISEIVLEDADMDDFTMTTRDFKALSSTGGIAAVSNSNATSTRGGSNVSSTLKLQMQVDELKLLNEQLKEQLKSYKTEHELFKDQSARQLKFLEDLNTKYKAEVDAARTKYYDEKKKWQTKLRESEDTVKKLQARFSAEANNNSNSSTNNDPPYPVRQTLDFSSAISEPSSLPQYQERLQALEAMITETQAEAKRNLTLKLEAEQRALQLEQELKLFTSSHAINIGNNNAVPVMIEDLQAELRQLRKQYQELETMYRRKAKEADKLQQQVKNQNMLEEELATCSTNYRLAQETIKNFTSMEIEHRRLVEENKTWRQVFQTLLSKNNNTVIDKDVNANSSSVSSSAMNRMAVVEDDASSSANSSATRAVTMVQEMQQTCLVLQGQVGDLERSIATLRSSLLKSETRALQSEQEKMSLEGKLEKLEAKQHVFAQQSRLYESELATLRTLLQSFDLEFSIGKPEAMKLVAAKESMIEGLRRDVDEARQRVQVVSQELLASQEKISAAEKVQQQLQLQITEMEKIISLHKETAAAANASDPSSSTTSVDAESLKALKEEVQLWREKYFALEEISGIDCLPHETKVLHLKLNPLSANFRNKETDEEMNVDNDDNKNLNTEETVSSYPSEVVKRYRIETRTLRTQLQQLRQEMTLALANLNNNNADGNPAGDSQSPNASMLYFNNTSTLLPSKPAISNNNNSNNNASGNNNAAGGGVDQAKYNARLKEMFKEKISTFREAVYLLTGYKMELYTADVGQGKTVNRLKIKSMYAEAPEDCLIFQLSDNGPELLESDFANRMDETLLQHLQRYQSVPAFLANITLTLFENSTFMG